MNKKFSTLMASLMLASAFSVSAQTEAEKYENGKYYLLGSDTDSKYISVVSTPGASYGTLQYVTIGTNPTLNETRNALWQVTVTKENEGNAPKYSFVNVATGQVLSVLTPDDNNGGTIPNATIAGGGFMEWYNGLSSTAITADNDFMSYVGQNDVIYLTAGTGNTVTVKRDDVAAAQADPTMIKIQPWKAAIVELGAEELNKELIMNSEDDESFTLSFNRDVTEGAENLFTGVELVAEDVMSTATPSISTGYVRLHVKDTKNYLVVDTALHAGSEALKQLPKFAYDDPQKEVVDGNNVKRNPKSFNFRFAYEPTSNRLLIKVEEWTKKSSSSKPTPVSGAMTGDGNTAYTYWNWGTSGNNVSDAYVRLVELSSVRELTVASEASETAFNVWTFGNKQGADDLEHGMLTKVTIGAGLNSYIPTTIPTGLYTIQYKGSNKANAATDNYYIANLGGYFGYAEEAIRQDFNHMPAAQWYVEQKGAIATAPVTITNREFFENANGGSGTNNDFGRNAHQYQAFKGPDGTVFFMGGALANDTLKFIPVPTVNKADSLLGYKHVDAEQAAVETYVFNYLHGLSLENGLNTPSDKDSLVRVDETGEKASFRLIPVVEHDSYGLQLSANDVKKTGVNNLIRNAYYIKAYDNSKFEGERYLTYDNASKKYVMSKTPTPYFLKENNCIDGTHYYALVEANLFVRKAEKGSRSEIARLLNNSNVTLYPAKFAGRNVKNLTAEEKLLSYNSQFQALAAGKSIDVPFYTANGTYIVEDGSLSVPLYAYQANNNGDIVLRRVNTGVNPAQYYYMNSVNTNDIQLGSRFFSWHYADSRVSVDDNTLDLTNAVLEDKWMSEIRVSAFEVAINDSPLYRRFNGAAPETYGDASNAPLNLKFFRHNNNAEYLFENYASENAYRDGITDKEISFLGVNNAFQFAESETRSYTMFVDTAYVRYNTPMPQYLIGVKPEVVEGDTILCDATTHQHKTPEEALACEHTQIKVGFTRAMYLFNAQDSVDVKNYDYQGKAAYGAQGYTRLAFKDAVHAQDTLYILNPGVTTEELQASNLKDGKMFARKIALDNNKHKNVVFQFRLIDEENNRFLIESEAEQNGAAVLNKNLKNVSIAPMRGGWVKIQNGVPVIARFQDFNEAIRQAEIFDVNDDIKYDAVDNEEIAVEGVTVVAGNGQVTIMGAAGKNVTITNILGKVIASQVIASDNATIAVPAGIVAVAVEGEAAVKAIVK